MYSQVEWSGLLVTICQITLFKVLVERGRHLCYFDVRGGNCIGGLRQRWIREWHQYMYKFHVREKFSCIDSSSPWPTDNWCSNCTSLTKHKYQLSYMWKQDTCCGLQNAEFNAHPHTVSQIWVCHRFVDKYWMLSGACWGSEYGGSMSPGTSVNICQQGVIR